MIAAYDTLHSRPRGSLFFVGINSDVTLVLTAFILSKIRGRLDACDETVCGSTMRVRINKKSLSSTYVAINLLEARDGSQSKGIRGKELGELGAKKLIFLFERNYQAF